MYEKFNHSALYTVTTLYISIVYKIIFIHSFSCENESAKQLLIMFELSSKDLIETILLLSTHF